MITKMPVEAVINDQDGQGPPLYPDYLREQLQTSYNLGRRKLNEFSTL